MPLGGSVQCVRPPAGAGTSGKYLMNSGPQTLKEDVKIPLSEVLVYAVHSELL